MVQNKFSIMKKTMFSLIILLYISLSSFTIIEEVAKTCRYRIYDANTGQTLGYVEVFVLSDNFNCGSPNALSAALEVWQTQNP